MTAERNVAENTGRERDAGGDQLPPLTMHHPRVSPQLAKQIRVVALDVDGVLSDGGVYLGATRPAAADASTVPFEFKRFDIKDGLGIQLMRDAGIQVVIITGRVSESVAMRAIELGVTTLVQDPTARKLPALRRIVSEFGCTLAECAFVGDDLPDIGVLREVGLPVAVGNAVPEVLQVATLRLNANGGFGAVREFAEVLLSARGEWIDRVAAYVAARNRDDTP